MEAQICSELCSLRSLSKLPMISYPKTPFSGKRSVRKVVVVAMSATTAAATAPLAQPGGKMVVELVGAFNELTDKMNTTVLSTSSSRLLFKALKLSIPILHSLPPHSQSRSPLSRALSVAVILANLQVKTTHFPTQFNPFLKI